MKPIPLGHAQLLLDPHSIYRSTSLCLPPFTTHYLPHLWTPSRTCSTNPESPLKAHQLYLPLIPIYLPGRPSCHFHNLLLVESPTKTLTNTSRLSSLVHLGRWILVWNNWQCGCNSVPASLGKARSWYGILPTDTRSDWPTLQITLQSKYDQLAHGFDHKFLIKQEVYNLRQQEKETKVRFSKAIWEAWWAMRGRPI